MAEISQHEPNTKIASWYDQYHIESLLRTRARHAPPPELDARIRQMIATHPRHAAAQFVPGPFTWRDWYHVALALSLGPMVILSFYLAMPPGSPAHMPRPQQKSMMSFDDDLSLVYLSDTAGNHHDSQISLFKSQIKAEKPPGS